MGMDCVLAFILASVDVKASRQCPFSHSFPNTAGDQNTHLPWLEKLCSAVDRDVLWPSEQLS